MLLHNPYRKERIMSDAALRKTVEILLVEDNPVDV